MFKDLQTDVCVVGAGTAGLLLASRLAKTGKQVLVVEQGPDTSGETRKEILQRAIDNFDYGADYNDHLSKDVLTPTSGVSVGRLFGTGGTALHFGGWMVRPIEQDLRSRSLFNVGRDWPLSYAEFEPWLTEAEYEIGVAAAEDNRYASRRSRPFPMPAHAFSSFDKHKFGPGLEALDMVGHSCPFAVASNEYKRVGFDAQPACQGCRYCKACPTGARFSPDLVHGAWLKKQPNVKIVNNLSLRRLESSPDGTRIVAGHAKTTEEHEPVTIRAEHFALTMGGVATARILLLSNENKAHPKGIGNNNKQIGRNFGDHFGSIAVLELDKHVGGRLGFTTMQCDHGRHEGIDRREEPGWILVGEPLGDVFPMQSAVIPWAMEKDEISLARLRESIPRVVNLYAMHEYSDSGTFSLDTKQHDAFGDPVANMNLPLTDWDRRAGPTFSKLVDRLADVMGASDRRIITEPFSAYGHPAGATAMGATADDGVCDSNLRVFGVENLYLCSASVIPHMGANPPTLSIAALALRLAKHVGGEN